METKKYFHSRELTEAIDNNKKNFENSLAKIQAVSDDIKNLQEYLQDQFIHFDVKYHLFDEMENGAKIEVYLSFVKLTNDGKKRILVERKNLITNDISCRPLEEYKAIIRLKLYDFLPAFVNHIGLLMKAQEG